MKAVNIVIEFLIAGTVGLLVTVFVFSLIDLPLDLPFDFPEDPFSQAIAGVLALPGIYYLGIAIHHASWLLWRKYFHRPLFAKIFTDREPGKAHQAMRDHAKKAYINAHGPVDEDHPWEATIEWCRFAILQFATEDARQEYARQYHLYRASYGALSAFAFAFVVAVISCFFHPELWWLPVTLLGFSILLVHAAWHRGGRMWKSLCYSTSIAMERGKREQQPNSGES